MANTIGSSTSGTSPESNKLGNAVLIRSDVIPIIFIPGIMGSNVADLNGKNVWSVPNTDRSISRGALTAYSRSTKSPAQLQKELDSEKTKLDKNGYIANDPRIGLTNEQLKKMGWGSVDMFSYAKILHFLSLHLNNIALDKPERPKFNSRTDDNVDGSSENTKYTKQLEQYNKSSAYVENWLSILNQSEQKKWNALKTPFVPITKENINHLKKFNFPVYALGYNWLQSNSKSAVEIVKTLKAIKAEHGTKFRKFIIVTHSMGGLVTREIIKALGPDIAGVVHGVMPADGAAAAYRRIVAGSFEGTSKLSIDYLTANVIGLTAESVTAVLANAPGGLELLPNKVYNSGKPWLHLTGKDAQGKSIKVSYPQKGDPYNEIYKKDGVWWEMVKEEFLDPNNQIKVEKGKSKKSLYYQKIEDVKNFHDNLIKSYHPCTYLHWGNNPNSSFATLTWTLNQNLVGFNETQLSSLPRATKQEMTQSAKKEFERASENQSKSVDPKQIAKDNDGIRYISLKNGKLAYFSISKQDASGDGTVPTVSGKAPFLQRNVPVKQAFEMQGFGHQDNYQNIVVQRSVLYSIVSIVKDNNIQPKNR